jgi:hypothetical protein
MMDDIVGLHANRLIEIVSTGVQVPVESGEVTAGHLDADPVTLIEVITG